MFNGGNMSTVLEEALGLINEGQLESAGRLVREKWPQILSAIDSGQRGALLESCPPSQNSLLWIAVL